MGINWEVFFLRKSMSIYIKEEERFSSNKENKSGSLDPDRELPKDEFCLEGSNSSEQIHFSKQPEEPVVQKIEYNNDALWD